MPETPTFAGVLGQVLDTRASQIQAVEPGIVVSFNRTNQTAEVRPLLLNTDGTQKPVVPAAPVVMPIVYADIQEGEEGLLLVGDWAFQRWFRTGQVEEPEGNANHELANAYFIPGIRSSQSKRSYGSNETVVPKPSAGGEVKLGSTSANESLILGDAWLKDQSNSPVPVTGTALLDTLEIWATAVDGLTPTGVLGPLVTAIQAIKTGVAAGTYASSVSKTE